MPENYDDHDDQHDENDLRTVTSASEAHTDGDSQLAKTQAELLYLRAEFDNFRKRIARDQELAIRAANEKLIHELFSVIDLFDHAIESAQTLKAEPAVSSFIAGVEMTRKELSTVLGRFGVEFVGVRGEKFDPNRHEAVAQQPVSEDKNDTVLHVLQIGGTVQGKLVKAARVVVGRSET